MRLRLLTAASAVVLTVGIAACGSSAPSTSAGGSGSGQTATVDPSAPEVNPAGDIPDDQAFVRYAPPGSSYSVEVPEGWARTEQGGAVTFTDKLNRIRMQSMPADAALTPAAAEQQVAPSLAKTVPGFKLEGVTSVTRRAGEATLITYLGESPPDAVTGKTHVDAVERYAFFHRGESVVLTLSGPQGADNVDPWKIVTDSLEYTS